MYIIFLNHIILQMYLWFSINYNPHIYYNTYIPIIRRIQFASNLIQNEERYVITSKLIKCICNLHQN